MDASWFFNTFKDYSVAVLALVAILATCLVFAIVSITLKKVEKRLKNKNRRWESAILLSLHNPLCVFIWFWGVYYSVQLLISYSSDELSYLILLAPFTQLVMAVLFVWFFMSFVKQIEKLLLEPVNGRKALNITTIRAIGQVLRVAVIVISVLIVMQNVFGIGASAILAVAGGGGITIGWAAKDMLANFFGGLMIFLDRPFSIGDRIVSSEKNIDGIVEHIGWRLTKIRTLEKVPLYIPNSIFTTMTLQNPSRMSHRRIREFIGIRYEDEDKLPNILKDVKAMLSSHEGLDQNQSIAVAFSNLSPSSIEFLVQCFTKTTDFMVFSEVKEDILFKILKIISDHNAKIAYPTSSIYIESESNVT